VSGHVDGIGEVLQMEEEGRSVKLLISAPDVLAKYIAQKGSICVDGVSLTVNEVPGTEFKLNIVPHTLQETTMSGYRPGCQVNLEVDIIARYLERLLLGEQVSQPTNDGLTIDTMLKTAVVTPIASSPPKGPWERKNSTSSLPVP